MAKNNKRKGYRYLPVDEQLAVGTLGARSVIKSDFDSVLDNDMFFMSFRGTWAIEAHTAAEGPIVVGLAHSDYTSAEVEEALEAIASWDQGDKVAQEQARRKVRTVGVFDGLTTIEKLNDGRAFTTKLRFMVEIGETLAAWAWNQDAAQLADGTILKVQGGVSARRRR